MSTDLSLIVGENPIAFAKAVLADLDLALERDGRNLAGHYRLITTALRAVISAGAVIPEPPTDEEREAIRRVAAAIYFEDNSVAPDEEDEAADDYEATYLMPARVGFLAGVAWRHRHRGPITDEVVMAAAIAFTCETPEQWDALGGVTQGYVLADMRDALEAAEALR